MPGGRRLIRNLSAATSMSAGCVFISCITGAADAAKDDQKRTHPCMIPYDSLSREDQEKDDSAWQLIESVYTGKEETA